MSLVTFAILMGDFVLTMLLLRWLYARGMSNEGTSEILFVGLPRGLSFGTSL